MCQDLKYFEQHSEIFFRKKVKTPVLGIDTDPNRPDPDRHALDANPNQYKWCRSNPIRIHNTDMDHLYSVPELYIALS
jgi:hypothetical protein